MERRRFLQAAGLALGASALIGRGSAPMQYKLGKLPAQRDLYKIKLVDYTTPTLPKAPLVFGHYREVPCGWRMMGNDRVGDCVLAGAAHEHMLWSSEAGCVATFTDANVLGVYSAITGYDSGQTRPDGSNPTDQGTSVGDAMSYRRNTGIPDASGKIHKIAAFADIELGNLDLLATAAHLLSAVGIGVNFPSTAMDQFNRGVPWDVVPGARVEGGHYVPIVGRLANGNFLCVTWGKLQEITPRFLLEYCDEAIAIFSTDFLVGGKSPEGLDAQTLIADFDLT